MRPTVWIMSQMVCIGSIGRIALGRVSGRPEAGAASGADRAGELVPGCARRRDVADEPVTESGG
jgi:hypothetical protein